MTKRAERKAELEEYERRQKALRRDAVWWWKNRLGEPVRWDFKLHKPVVKRTGQPVY